MTAATACSRLALLAFLASATLVPAAACAARPELTYESQVTLKAPPQKAWDAFKTFGAIHEWHPATEGMRLLVG